MGSKKFTLFELHIDGETQVGPAALPDAILGGAFGTTREAETAPTDEAASEAAESEEEDGGGRGAVAVVAGLVALVAIAIAVRKFRGGDDAEPLEPAEERDVVVS